MPKAFLIFPGIWVVATFALCLSGAYSPLAGLLASIVGLSCFVFASWRARRSGVGGIFRGRFAAMACIAIVALSMVASETHADLSWDPIGAVDDNGWGYPSCNPPKDAHFENPTHDLVAVVRLGICSSDPLGVGVYPSYYVFVHPNNVENSKKNLVFRYSATQSNHAAPVLKWLNARAVKISSRSESVARVTKRMASINGTRIIYDIGSTQEPRALTP